MKSKFLLSKKKVLEQFARVNGIADIISYSSKTNPLITPLLEEATDCMFSIHMQNELVHVNDLKRVWFLTQAWEVEDVHELIGKGITSFVIDNEPDLEVLLDYLRKHDVKISLLLRTKLREMSIRTERHFVFGMSTEKVNEHLRNIRKEFADKLHLLGVHVHRKTQNMSEWRYEDEFQDMIDQDVWELLDVVNIGGGIPSMYANTNDDVIEAVLKKIEQVKAWVNEKGCKLMLEPGRFIAAPSVQLKTEVKNVYERTIIVDASVYNCDTDAFIVPVKLLVEGEGTGEQYTIKGCTPCSLDLFRYRVYLPYEVKKGDTITFLHAGAYNFTTDFCDLQKIPTEVVA